MFESESRILEANGHTVLQYKPHNDATSNRSAIHNACSSIWNSRAYKELQQLCREFNPDVAHFHNIQPLVSLAGYQAMRESGTAVVQTLHNYRLLCPVGYLSRNGKVCEECIGSPLSLPGIIRGCYRQSRAATAAVSLGTAIQRSTGVWTKDIDRFIALTEFARAKFIAGGLPEDRIAVKANSTCPTGASTPPGHGALFVGRLTEEKGIRTLLRACKLLDHQHPVRILGDGPLAGEVQAACDRFPWVHWEGSVDSNRVAEALREAAMLVFPSQWYEGMPMAILEAFSHARPVLASKLGAMHCLIKPDYNGALFPPGDAEALATQIHTQLNDRDRLITLGRGAREDHQSRYSPEANHRALIDIYEQAIAQRRLLRAAS